MYAYAEGAHRQVIGVLSRLGITISYSALAGNQRFSREGIVEAATTASGGPEPAITAAVQEGESAQRDGQESSAGNPAHGAVAVSVVPSAERVEQVDKEARPTRRQRKAEQGLLKRLSDACRSAVRTVAATHLLGYVYDNINPFFRVAEQVAGRKDSVENGTAATAFDLHNARESDMKTSDYLHSFVTAPSLKLDDILLTPEENRTFRKRMVHTVLRLVVAQGGPSFARFRRKVTATTPASEERIALHTTTVYPLPTMHIDESSTSGNADVVAEILREVGQPLNSPDFAERVKILAGDQLSIARLRSLTLNR